MKKITFQPYSPGEEKEIIDLLKLGYDGWPPFDLKSSSSDHWSWRYKDNFTGQTIISVSKDGEKLIGCLHTIPKKMKVGDSVYLCCNGPDLVVLPEYRNRGVAKELDALVDDLRKTNGIKFAVFETVIPFYLRSLKRKQSLYVRMSHFVRIKNIGLHLDRTFYQRKPMVNFALRFFYFFNQLQNVFKNKYDSDTTIKITDIHRFDKRIDKLWDTVSDSYKLTTERTEKYLNWRYCDPRGGNYVVKCAQEKDQIIGYVVLRINKKEKKYPVGYIVDIFTLPNRDEITNALLAASVHFFDKNSINTIHLRLVRGHSYGKLLRKFGFMNSIKKKMVFFRPYGEVENEITRILSDTTSNIHITYGDEAFI
jgi:GNAT superfamily N-acetyltransferase